MKKNVSNPDKGADFDDNLEKIEQLLTEIEAPSIKLADLKAKNTQIETLLTICEQQLVSSRE